MIANKKNLDETASVRKTVKNNLTYFTVSVSRDW